MNQRAMIAGSLLLACMVKEALPLSHSLDLVYGRFNSKLGNVDGLWFDYNLISGGKTVRDGIQVSFSRLPYVNSSAEMRNQCGFYGVSYTKPLVFCRGCGRLIVRPGLGLVLGNARQDDLVERNDTLDLCFGCGDRAASPRLYLSPAVSVEYGLRLKGGFGLGLGLSGRYLHSAFGSQTLDVPAAPEFHGSYGSFLAVSYGRW